MSLFMSVGNITFIIPNRGLKTINYVIEQLKKYWKDEKFIVVNQEDDEPFKRGQLFNIAVKYVNTEYICLIDGDIFFQKYIDLIGIYKNKNCQVLQPFNVIQQIEIKDGNISVLKTEKKIIIDNDNKLGPRGGISFMSTKAFKELNGFSNILIGWGYEDNEFCCRCDRGKFINVDNTICHIHHVRRNANNTHIQLNKIFFHKETIESHAGYNEVVFKEVFKRNLTNNVLSIGVCDISTTNIKAKQLLDLHKPENIKHALTYISDYNIKTHVTSNYVLLGVPRHMNIGDTIIWEAEKQLLGKLPYKRIGTFFWGTPPKDIKVSNTDTIIFSGGGYLNDIWGGTIDYINKILEYFPNNKVVFLPNSIYFKNVNAASFKKLVNNLNNKGKNCVIFSREKQSLENGGKYFKKSINQIMPDVVLTWDIKQFIDKYKTHINEPETSKTLFINRNDKELKDSFDIVCDVKTDWPQLINKPDYVVDNMSCADYDDNIKDKLIIDSINFINQFKCVYSNRMHGAILSWLLNKETYLIDNSYGKSKSLFDTWLYYDNNIKMIEKPNQNRNKIVVTMTSWTKRIKHVKTVIESILGNTVLPDRIYLNLSEDEFSNKELDLPKDLVDLFNNNDRLVLNWVKKNTKSMKKVFPILQYLDDNDIIIDADDDKLFPKDLIESRLNDYKQCGMKFPITSNKARCGIGEAKVISPMSLFRKDMLNNWEKFVDDVVINTYNDDRTYLYVLYLNGYIAKSSSKYDEKELIKTYDLHLDGSSMKTMRLYPIGKRYDEIVRGSVKKLTNKSIAESFNFFNSNANENRHDCVMVYHKNGLSSKEMTCGEHLEIEYVIKSLKKYCTSWLGKIYVVGSEPPKEMENDVVHVECDNPYTHIKDANIIHKLRYACENIPTLSDDFLMISDDQIVTKESKFEDFQPRYIRKFSDWSNEKWQKNRKIDIWHESLYQTLLRFDKKESAMWEPHIWSPMNKHKFIKMCETFDYEHEIGCIILSLYYNFIKQPLVKNFDHTYFGEKRIIRNLKQTILLNKNRHLAWNDEVFQHKEFRDYLDKLVGFNGNTNQEEHQIKIVEPKNSNISKIREDIANGKVVKIRMGNGYIWKRIK